MFWSARGGSTRCWNMLDTSYLDEDKEIWR